MSETFGQRLSRLRKEKGLTQEDIAKRIIISPQAVSKWENDISSPDILVLSSLADILGVSVDKLLGREEINEDEVISEEAPKEERVEAEVVDDDDDDDDDDDEVRIGSDGIHVEKKNGKSVHITEDGIHVVEADGESKDISIKDKIYEHRGSWITTATLFGLALIGFILMGILWTDQSMGWKMGWTLFFFPIIISSIVEAIKTRYFTKFAYPVAVTAAYVILGFLGMYFGFEGWGFYWFLFITIPAYYLIFGPIDNYTKRNRK